MIEAQLPSEVRQTQSTSLKTKSYGGLLGLDSGVLPSHLFLLFIKHIPSIQVSKFPTFNAFTFIIFSDSDVYSTLMFSKFVPPI